MATEPRRAGTAAQSTPLEDPENGAAAPAAPGAAAAPAPRDRGVPDVAASKLAGFAGSRFAVIDTSERALVFDADSSTSFGVYGHPTTSPVDAFDIWEQAGLTGDVLHSRLEVSADGSRMLVRTEHGVQAIDLENRGALLAGWRGDAAGASMADDGQSFATWTSAELSIVRIADGARVSFSFAPANGSLPVVTWRARSASWTDETGAHIVDRTTWRAQHVAIPGATIVTSKDGAVVAVVRDGTEPSGSNAATAAVVEVWRAGDARPAAHIESAFASNLVMDDAGTKVAWAETAMPAPEATHPPTHHLHTLDLASGAHVRFAAKSPSCTLGPEYIVAIENGQLHTDGECSPGCPSLTRQADLRAYDFSRGSVLRHWTGPRLAPFNEELGAKMTVVSLLAKRHRMSDSRESPLPIVHHPAADFVLVESGDVVRLADVASGGAAVTLEKSAHFGVTTMHFWPGSGARIVGVREGAVAVWDTATGRRLWGSER